MLIRTNYSLFISEKTAIRAVIGLLPGAARRPGVRHFQAKCRACVKFNFIGRHIYENNANFAASTYNPNKMRARLLATIIMLWCAFAAHAQKRPHVRHTKRAAVADTSVTAAYVDSLKAYKAKSDSLFRLKEAMGLHPEADARFFKLFAPLTFYYSVANGSMVLGEGGDDIDRAIDKALVTAYLRHPGRVVSTEDEIRKAGSLHEEITKPLRHKVEYTKGNDYTNEEAPLTPFHIVVDKPNFWTFSGDYYLQFLQNFVSDNWYKGGESNYSMLASATLQANYNNKQKVKFENKLELKLGFQTSRGDTLHSFKTSEDLIRYTGKLGLQATKNWYYTLQLIANTQFMRGYKSNDPFVYSDLLSPLNMNFSLGMSYNVNAFKGKLTGSAQMAPFAYNFKYVGRKSLATQYGLKEGRHTLNDFGSEFTFDLTWVFSELIKWKTRLYGYTTYKRTSSNGKTP